MNGDKNVKEVVFITKICYLEDCIYRDTPGCRVYNLDVYGVIGCGKYKNEADSETKCPSA